MQLPSYTREQFTDAFLSLLPTGRAWPREPDTALVRTVAALMPAAERVSIRASNLLADTIPSGTNELLSEWEESLGLPDPCAGIAPSTEARRAQAVARFVALGGQSIAELQAFAANLGYPITISEFYPTRAGVLRAGDALMGVGTQFTLRIDAPITNQRFFTAGSAAAGDPLSSFGNQTLECEMQAIKPAHSRIYHTYTGATTVYKPGPIVSITVLQ